MSTRPRQTRAIPSKIASSTVKSRQTVKERPSSLATVTPTQLLQALSNSKETTGATVKSLDILLNNLAAEDAQRTAMKAVNATSFAIATVHKSGWVYTSPADSYTTDNVEHTISAANLALSVLRDRDAASGTERAALGLIGRLMAIKAWNGAWNLIQGVRTGVLKLYRAAPLSKPASDVPQEDLHLLKLPLAMNPATIDSELIIIISTYLSYAFQTVLQRSSGNVKFQQDIISPMVQMINPGTDGDGHFLSWLMSTPDAALRKQLYPLSISLLKVSEVVSQSLRAEDSMVVRIYTVRCVLLVSSPEDATWIWKQVRNIAASYVKVFSGGILQHFPCLHAILVSCVESARFWNDDVLFKDPSFEVLCQQWIKIAMKSNDQQAVDFVQLLPQSAATPSSRPFGFIQFTVQNLSSYCAGVEESIANKNVDQVKTQLRLAHEEITRATQEEYQGFPPNAAKLFQATERLRRRMRTASDDDSMIVIASRFQELFQVIIQLYSTLLKKGTLQDVTRLDIVSASLESLITLSKRIFHVQDPESYENAYQHLEDASTLVNEFYVGFGVKVAKERTLDLWRCLSGAFWNLGSSLYQAGRWDHSVPYISKSVDIDKILLDAGWSTSENMNNNWTVFFEQMPKRAMLLATCFIKMNNRQRAYELYRAALSCYLRTLAVELEGRASNIPSSAVFSTPKYLPIVTNVEKITYIGALELFLGNEVNLSPLAASLGLSPLMRGALIEQQIRSLERSFWKPEVRPIIVHLLQDAADVYSTSHPLRQARVLCIHLEYAYYDQCSWKEAENLSHMAMRLLGSKDFKLDSPLAQYQPQYLITMNLWMAFHSHSNRDHDAISSFAYKARDILIAAIAPELANTPVKGAVMKQAPKPKATKDTKPSTRIANSTVRKTGVPRPKKGEALPRSRTASNIPNMSGGSSIAAGAPLVSNFDCPDAFWLQIEMSLNLFSALGLIELKLTYLNICCMFLKAREGALERDLYAKLLIEFANECAKLGRIRTANEAFEGSLQLIKENAVNDQTNLLFLLRFAGFLAVSGNTAKGLELYTEAAELSRSLEWDLQNSSTLERARSRVQHYALTALACSTYSIIQIERGDFVAASRGYLQAMRIWNAAIDVTRRLDPKHPPKHVEKNPFDMDDLISALPETQPPRVLKADIKARLVQRPGPEGWHLVLARELLEAQSRMSEHCLNKGSPRDAEYFILQCRTLSEALGAPIHLLRSICLQTYLQIRLWHTDNSCNHLKEAKMLAKDNGPSLTAEVLRLEGQYNERIGETSRAKMCFIDGQAQLLQYSRDLDVTVAQNRFEQSEVKTTSDDFTLPSLLANLLRHQIWLSREEEYAALIDNIETLPAIGDIKAQEKVLMARLANHISRRQLSQEASLGSLGESVIAVPLGVVGVADMEMTRSQQGLMDLLKTVEKYCWSVLTDLRNRGSVAHYREIILLLVSSIATKANLGGRTTDDADVAVSLLDWAAAETLRRELLETIEQKLQSKGMDDMEWPLTARPNSSKSSSSRKVPVSARSLFGDPDGSDKAEAIARAYWTTIRDRHRDLSLEVVVKSLETNRLPGNWTIVNIGISDGEDSLFIARSRLNQRSLLFCIPLKRSIRNEADATANSLMINSAVVEMNDIVESSRKNGKRAGEVAAKGRELRAEWWSERAALDQRLSDLLENIEFCWLGAFKCILSPRRFIKEEDLSSIHDKFYHFFAKIAHKNEKKGLLPASLDKALVECFSNLSPVARDEELEDFIYFFLDLYQSTGHRVFLSDLDIDDAILELRAVLKEVHLAVKRSDIVEDEHTFLVLDKRLQGIPWESIPILRGRAVSRIPSTAFLLDRLHLASVSEKSAIATKNQPLDRISVDPTEVYYLLNPEGDLKRTEETFTPWLRGMDKVGWAGIIGRRPAEFELKDALSRRDLFIYFGHGGAEQYIRGSQIRSLLRCSSTMLWGCSSGAMEEAGDFDRNGTPYDYLLGGCPSLVVNLWDVTDKDIDKFAQSVFNKLKLEPEAVKARKQGKGSGKAFSVVRAVAESREVCKLKYLTGAAPIVYGIPFYL